MSEVGIDENGGRVYAKLFICGRDMKLKWYKNANILVPCQTRYQKQFLEGLIEVKSHTFEMFLSG